MIFFLFFGLVELIGIIVLFRLFNQKVICKYRKKSYKIDEQTTILITGALMGIVYKDQNINSNNYIFLREGEQPIILFKTINAQEDLQDEIIEELEQCGGQCKFYRCDVSNEEEVQAVTKQTLQEFKCIDILINNAGIANLKLFQDSTIQQIKQVMAVNYYGPVSLIKQHLPKMLERNSGHIVNISSVASLMPSIKMSEYCASKAALSSFHNALRLELKEMNSAVKTTVICPYAINTGMFHGWQTKLKNLFPVLDETVVAQETYEAILQSREEVFIPWSWKVNALLIRALPARLTDWLLVSILGELTLKLTGRPQSKSKTE